MDDGTVVMERRFLRQVSDTLERCQERLEVRGEGNLALFCAAVGYELRVRLGLEADWRADIRVPRPE